MAVKIQDLQRSTQHIPELLLRVQKISKPFLQKDLFDLFLNLSVDRNKTRTEAVSVVTREGAGTGVLIVGCG